MLLQEIKNDDALELANIVRDFPKVYVKIIRQLAGKPHKLKYQGLDLFDEDGVGPVLHDAIKEIRRRINVDRKYSVDVCIHAPLGGRYQHLDELPFEATVADVQHVWTAYIPSKNSLLMGFDAWINEEDFNSEWDNYFQQRTGEPFDIDNETHEALFAIAHRNFINLGFFGLLFVVSVSAGGVLDINLLDSCQNGFFKGMVNNPFLNSIEHIEL